jgi:hypothetical protein
MRPASKDNENIDTINEYEDDPLAILGPEGEKKLRRRRALNGMIWTILAMIAGFLFAFFSH